MHVSSTTCLCSINIQVDPADKRVAAYVGNFVCVYRVELFMNKFNTSADHYYCWWVGSAVGSVCLLLKLKLEIWFDSFITTHWIWLLISGINVICIIVFFVFLLCYRWNQQYVWYLLSLLGIALTWQPFPFFFSLNKIHIYEEDLILKNRWRCVLLMKL